MTAAAERRPRPTGATAAAPKSRPTVLADGAAAVGQDSGSWVNRLAPGNAGREQALRELHALLAKGARFEIGRRRATLPHLRGDDYEDLIQQSADDALVAILSKLGEFRGDSRFTTWAYKFALYEAAAKVRRRAWQDREVPLEPEGWSRFANGDASPQQKAETGELLASLRRAIDEELSPHQREVLVAVTLNDVPIDVLAERLETTRGALYKTIHDARKKLRQTLDEPTPIELPGSSLPR